MELKTRDETLRDEYKVTALQYETAPGQRNNEFNRALRLSEKYP